jgi:hypothetical protein
MGESAKIVADLLYRITRVCRDRAVGAGRDDRFNAPLDQLSADRVAVAGPIGDQPPGHAAPPSADPNTHPLELWL